VIGQQDEPGHTEDDCEQHAADPKRTMLDGLFAYPRYPFLLAGSYHQFICLILMRRVVLPGFFA